MKHNKGFAPVAILFILLGVLAAGGIAYYSSKNSVPKNESPNDNVPPVQNTNTQISDCNPNSPSSITVLSPNGGEVFTEGQEITVKWTSCNVPENTLMTFALYGLVGDYGNNSFQTSEITANTGSVVLTLPLSQIDGVRQGIKTYGKLFKIYAGTAADDQSYSSSDTSDNFFTINKENPRSLSLNFPEYVGTVGNCGNGTSLCWPPVVTTSSEAYYCNNIGTAPNTEGNDVTTEKVINGRTYCIRGLGDNYTSHHVIEYTYKTKNGAGTKLATFTVNYGACGVYDNPAFSQCQINQKNFSNNLDNLIDSLM